MYCPDLEQNCGYGYVDQMETLLPWSNCSLHYIGNSYENYSWVCEPYCTEPVGGVMPSAGVSSNRAEGTNTCPSPSPTVAPSVDPSIVPTIAPAAHPTQQPTSNATKSTSSDPSQQQSPHPTQPPSLNPTYPPTVNSTHAPSTDPLTQTQS